MDTAKDVAADIYREAMASAKEQGLSAEGLKEAAGEVADKVRAAVAGAIGGQNSNSKYRRRSISNRQRGRQLGEIHHERDAV